MDCMDGVAIRCPYCNGLIIADELAIACVGIKDVSLGCGAYWNADGTVSILPDNTSKLKAN